MSRYARCSHLLAGEFPREEDASADALSGLSPYKSYSYRTPVVSLMVQMVWTCILCVSGSYGQLLDYIVFAVLVFYILTIVALFVLRQTRPNAERPYRAIGYPVLPAIYIVMALFIDVVLLRYKPQFTWPGLIIVLLGVPVYFVWSRNARVAMD